MQLCSYQMYKLFTGVQFFKKNAGEGRGCCNRILFLNTPYLHAHVLCFNYNSNAQRIEAILEAIPYLGSQALLNLQPPAESLHYTCNLAQTSNISVWNIGNMCLPEKREHVMFAH